MAKPGDITREHILKAILEFDTLKGMPIKRRASKKFLNYNGRHYPTKYIISVANRYLTKVELDPDPNNFTSNMAEKYLKDKGFEVIRIGK